MKRNLKPVIVKLVLTFGTFHALSVVIQPLGLIMDLPVPLRTFEAYGRYAGLVASWQFFKRPDAPSFYLHFRPLSERIDFEKQTFDWPEIDFRSYQLKTASRFPFHLQQSANWEKWGHFVAWTLCRRWPHAEKLSMERRKAFYNLKEDDLQVSRLSEAKIIQCRKFTNE